MTPFTRSEERGVAIGVDGVEFGGVLEEELDAPGMPREGSSVKCWGGGRGEGGEIGRNGEEGEEWRGVTHSSSEVSLLGPYQLPLACHKHARLPPSPTWP